MSDRSPGHLDLASALLEAAEELREAGDDPARVGYRALPLLESLGVEALPSGIESADTPALSSTIDLGPGRTVSGAARPPDRIATIGRFLPTSELGRGGMGRVLEARDPELCRTVAVKVVLDPDRVSADRLRRFIQEAQVTSQLEHPSIVPVHDLGVTIDGRVYYVMKRVEGASLRSVLRRLRAGDEEARSRWTRHRLLTVFVRICEAVAYAHSRGVLHRDLKPDNVMLGAFGEVQVMDWGLARVLSETDCTVEVDTCDDDGDGSWTRDGAAIGTPGYMSPEQAVGRSAEVGPRSDVWSLGAILHELLTWQRAIPGDSVGQRLHRTVTAAPVDPRVAAPQMGVPDEIAGICTRALSLDPEERPASAEELQAEVEGFLEGSRRKRAARAELERAEELWRELAAGQLDQERLREELTALEGQVVPWASLDDPLKKRLQETRQRLDELVQQQAIRFSQAVAGAERALSQDPSNVAARGFLARAYWSRFEEAERDDDPAGIAFFSDRVREYDTGPFAALLEGTGALSLETTPAGARILASRYRRVGLVWATEPPRDLGVTPLEKQPIEMGSYLLTLRADGRRDTLLPVLVGRAAHRSTGEEPVPLLAEEQIGPDWLYVPPGATVLGANPRVGQQFGLQERWLPGFLVARCCVTAGAYAEFLLDLARRGDASLGERVPRMPGAPDKPGREFWPRPEPESPLRFPLQDPDGDTWHADWPVVGIDWHSAMAYAAWRADRDGLPIRVQSELEYERAARGADGRLFPWGNRFDPSLCHMRASRPGRPQPEPVGSFPTDRSPFGVRDLAGSAREWCGEADFDGDPTRRPIRGGAWSTTERACRAVNRFGLEPHVRHVYLGVRLVQGLPPVEAPGLLTANGT